MVTQHDLVSLSFSLALSLFLSVFLSLSLSLHLSLSLPSPYLLPSPSLSRSLSFSLSISLSADSVPCSSLFAQLNGVQLCVDPASVLWMNLFSQGLLSTLEQVKAFYHLQDSGKGEEHVDARMDAAQLKVDSQH